MRFFYTYHLFSYWLSGFINKTYCILLFYPIYQTEGIIKVNNLMKHTPLSADERLEQNLCGLNELFQIEKTFCGRKT